MRNSVLATDRQTDGRMDGGTSAHVELRFAAKNLHFWVLFKASLTSIIFAYCISKNILTFKEIEKKLDEKEKALDKALDDSTNDSMNQFLAGVGDVAINVVAPTITNAVGGALLAHNMSNVESGIAAASLGVKSVMQDVAKPALQNHDNNKQKTTSTTQNGHKQMDNPVFLSFKKVMVKY